MEVSVGYDPTTRFIIKFQFSRLVQLFHFCQLTEKKRFTEKSSQKYIEMIFQIINHKPIDYNHS